MGDKGIETGVSHFFDDNEKQESQPPAALPVKAESANKSPTSAAPPARKGQRSKAEPVKARTGRPVGIPNGSRTHYAKASLSINAALLDFYRDWSWDERCNLGELIERALIAYKKHRKQVVTKDRERS